MNATPAIYHRPKAPSNAPSREHRGGLGSNPLAFRAALTFSEDERIPEGSREGDTGAPSTSCDPGRARDPLVRGRGPSRSLILLGYPTARHPHSRTMKITSVRVASQPTVQPKNRSASS